MLKNSVIIVIAGIECEVQCNFALFDAIESAVGRSFFKIADDFFNNNVKFNDVLQCYLQIVKHSNKTISKDQLQNHIVEIGLVNSAMLLIPFVQASLYGGKALESKSKNVDKVDVQHEEVNIESMYRLRNSALKYSTF